MSEASHSRFMETEYSEEAECSLSTIYKGLKNNKAQEDLTVVGNNYGLTTAFENLTAELASSTGQKPRENVGEEKSLGSWNDRPIPNLNLIQFILPSTNNINSLISDDQESTNNPTTEAVHGARVPRSQNVWELDKNASECRRCDKRFNFLIRRHHCRRCGQVVCDKCSLHRVRLPANEIVKEPTISSTHCTLIVSQSQRVCDACIKEIITSRSELRYRRYSSHHQMQRSNSSQSLMIDCPVCGKSFLTIKKREQEEHLQQCLNVGSPPVNSPRYIVYTLANDSTQIGDECSICFDEFELGEKISRMICLCSYHQHCLESWLQKGRGCPVHYDFFIQNED